MKRAFFHFACVLLLLVAQQGAITHAVWHLHDSHPMQGQEHSEAPDQSGGSGKSPQSTLCDLHSIFGSVLAGDCPGNQAVLATDFTHSNARAVGVWRLSQPASTPRSRAPPVLL